MESARIGLYLGLVVERQVDRHGFRTPKRWRSRLAHLAMKHGLTATEQAVVSCLAAGRRFDEDGSISIESIRESLRMVRNILADQRSTVIADMNRRAMIQATAERN